MNGEKSCFTNHFGYVNQLSVSTSRHRRHLHHPGLTLIEITIVLCVLMALIGTGLYVGGSIKTWRAGREAAEALRTVYSAQRMYLADNPTVAKESITREQLIPYLPDRATAMPTVKPLKGNALSIRVTVIPPVLVQGGSVYDPSGSSTDNLWDVGE
ncbi:type II secretion system protein [Luteolibacter sp. SL250]|uniref:type II secretion system protein n=1 Tax=Luteolibacter sp. SL250 TaxID=2995170 RepID=UPI0022702484|nr:type II secretion system protein [Luteolibacter sp. SL250]WAC21561.1 type II secretion system protein [Luteolibacter sp. SL250]